MKHDWNEDGYCRDRACPLNARIVVRTAYAEIGRLVSLSERLRLEAEAHAQEARTQRATVHEIYQCVSGATGEPGDWHGAEPARVILADLRAEVARLRRQYVLTDDTPLDPTPDRAPVEAVREYVRRLDIRVSGLRADGKHARADDYEVVIRELNAVLRAALASPGRTHETDRGPDHRDNSHEVPPEAARTGGRTTARVAPDTGMASKERSKSGDEPLRASPGGTTL